MSPIFVKRILRHTAEQIILTATPHDIENLTRSLPDTDEGSRCGLFLKAARVLRHGELMSLCWSSLSWYPEDSAEQAWLVRSAEEGEGFFALSVHMFSGKTEHWGSLDEHPSYNETLENAA